MPTGDPFFKCPFCYAVSFASVCNGCTCAAWKEWVSGSYGTFPSPNTFNMKKNTEVHRVTLPTKPAPKPYKREFRSPFENFLNSGKDTDLSAMIDEIIEDDKHINQKTISDENLKESANQITHESFPPVEEYSINEDPEVLTAKSNAAWEKFITTTQKTIAEMNRRFVKAQNYDLSESARRENTIQKFVALSDILRKEEQCGACGGTQVYVRGRYPTHDNRLVCPTCLADRMDNIHEISSKHYGIAVSEKKKS